VTTAIETTATEVYIRVAHDDDASRISAVLEALGYNVLRQLDEGDGPQRLSWAVSRLAHRHKLTTREQNILELVLEGRTNTQISRALDISRATVKWHMHNVFAKTNTGTRESLLRLALQLGGAESGEAAPTRPVAQPTAPRPVTSAPPRTLNGSRGDGSSWAEPDDVTARIDFDQPRPRSAETIPSKSWY
jgi:DNA-binding CsgD family transcriptional regulator